jgi:hypothetical protein
MTGRVCGVSAPGVCREPSSRDGAAFVRARTNVVAGRVIETRAI